MGYMCIIELCTHVCLCVWICHPTVLVSSLTKFRYGVGISKYYRIFSPPPPSSPPLLSSSFLLQAPQSSLRCHCTPELYHCDKSSSCVAEYDDGRTGYQELFCVIFKEFHDNGLEIEGSRCLDANAFDANLVCEPLENVSLCVCNTVTASCMLEI